MSKTLKTYPDGSEINTNHIAAFAVGSLIFSAAIAGSMEWWALRKNHRSNNKEIPGMFK